MALKPCRECKKEVSTEAKTCPHCGKKNPTRGGRRSWVQLAGGALVVVYTAFVIGQPEADRPESVSDFARTPSVSLSRERTDSPRNQALSQVKLKFTWRRGGFGTAMIADFVITNPSPWRIKDMEVTCDHFGPSGTKIDSNVRTIYQTVEPGETKKVDEFNMGIMHAQATKSSCSITNLVVDR